MIPNVGNLSPPSPTGGKGNLPNACCTVHLLRVAIPRMDLAGFVLQVDDRVQLHAIPLFGLLDVRM